MTYEELITARCAGCHGDLTPSSGGYFILGGRDISYPYHKSCAEDVLATIQTTLQINERLRKGLSRLHIAASRQLANSTAWKQTFNILADMDQELALLTKDCVKF